MEDDNRQEWIFTLYDFDNSGKVTKEVCVCVLAVMPSPVSVVVDVLVLFIIDSLSVSRVIL